MSTQMMNNDISIHVNALNTELNATIHPIQNEEEEEDTYTIQQLALWAFCAYIISILIAEVNNTPSVSISHFAKKLIDYNPSYLQLQVICIVAILCGVALFGALHVAFRMEEIHADLISKQNKEIQMLKARIIDLNQHSWDSTHKTMVSSMDTSNKHFTTIWKKME